MINLGSSDEGAVRAAHAAFEALGMPASGVKIQVSGLSRFCVFSINTPLFVKSRGSGATQAHIGALLALLEQTQNAGLWLCTSLEPYWEERDSSAKRISVVLWAETLLSDSGLPNDDGPVIERPDGSWHPWRPWHRTEAVIGGLSLAEKSDGTLEWYAAQVLRTEQRQRVARRERDHYVAGRCDGRLLELRAHVWWKLQHEVAAIKGHRVAERQQHGRSAKAANTTRRTQHSQHVLEAALAELVVQQPHLLGPRMQREAARQLAAMGLCDADGDPIGLGDEAIRKRLRKKMRALGMLR